jgi:hypothetical protein
MQLLDRYLTAIKFWLPKKQSKDIVAELEANLRAEIEDRAAALGRPLTEDEIAAILKEHGAPILVASRYQQETRTITLGAQLIGPIVFPFYWTAIKVTLLLLLIPGVVPAVVLGTQAHGQPFSQLGHALVRVAWLCLPALLLVTLVFAAIDFALRRFGILDRKDWDPRQLPATATQAKQVRRSSSIAGIIVQSLFILWWWKHGSIPYLVLNSGGARLQVAPVIASLYAPVLIILFINLAQHWINLMEPNWRWLPPATTVITSILGLACLYPLLGSSPLISLSLPNEMSLNSQSVLEIQRLLAVCLASLWIGICIAGAVSAWRLVVILWQSLPRDRSRPTQNGIAQAR